MATCKFEIEQWHTAKPELVKRYAKSLKRDDVKMVYQYDKPKTGDRRCDVACRGIEVVFNDDTSYFYPENMPF